mmetsp:Transcript_22902/g.71337  ORF Transcript_22902/g.71337 Transcript_22902/m.71337 type:complete len:260 (+) Transcript_22902:68-847(+)|eukprot:CAMPEP_0204563822 /NCGR_PEP_ID=MMETSP0661-20131031/34534_1 /ASSEMBLY_ACC=CAM_ASM_000606 /TAXON_ID=109239 /ORGANISM="Alexandrium margalefi, Strain AMGDE01CS-322" /LENGTH=259 /DNA_ID=CAMNT_0051571413 /DNA_START=68 /DNA_END=847 /DNA_ORIENTATION=-
MAGLPSALVHFIVATVSVLAGAAPSKGKLQAASWADANALHLHDHSNVTNFPPEEHPVLAAGSVHKILTDLKLRVSAEQSVSYTDPRVWGPPTWFFLHTMTLALPEEVPPETRAGLKSVMIGMQEVLPCAACRRHLARHLWSYPLEEHAATRAGMVDWMINLHNTVNNDLGKRVVTREEVLSAYESAYTHRGEHRKGYEELLTPGAVGPRLSKPLAVLGFLGVAVGTSVLWLHLKSSHGVDVPFAWRRCPSALEEERAA